MRERRPNREGGGDRAEEEGGGDGEKEEGDGGGDGGGAEQDLRSRAQITSHAIVMTDT